MKILIKIPSRSRPEQLINTLKKFIELADNLTYMLFVVSLDTDDVTVTHDLIHSLLKLHINVSVSVKKSNGKVSAINRDIRGAFFDILIAASDDMIPQVHGYDTIIRTHMIKHYPDTDGVIYFNDGYVGSRLNTLPIIGRKYYERFNYIYHPAYKSFWCDNEFTDVANSLKRQTYFDSVLIKHNHPFFTGETPDELYLNACKRDFESDRQTYEKRKKLRFQHL